VDIVEFLTARIEEDEAAALKLLGDPTLAVSGEWYERRLLRECEAKRRLIDIIESARQSVLTTLVSQEHGDSRWVPDVIEWTTLSLNTLALPYADHPEFQARWRAPGS
jgi:hypothetical protein